MKIVLALAFLWCFGSSTARADDDTRISTLTIQTHDATVSFLTEIAISEDAKERGLMFRQIMPENQAMLFAFSPPQPVQFWMKNTLIALDLIFVRADGTIADIKENAVPKSLAIIDEEEPVVAVIEVAGGVTHKRGIHKGDHVGGAALQGN